MAQKILIVEDEENIAQLLHLYLEKEQLGDVGVVLHDQDFF